jgi:hypothetical protein
VPENAAVVLAYKPVAYKPAPKRQPARAALRLPARRQAVAAAR